jgi:predicted nucleic acid-binding protein
VNRLPGLTLDTGALIGFERGDERARGVIRRARDSGREVTVPAVALAEAWRGGNARLLADLLDAARVEALNERIAKRAGELLARTATSNTIDAIVAVSAAQRGDLIVTADPDDLKVYTDDLRTVRVLRV